MRPTLTYATVAEREATCARICEDAARRMVELGVPIWAARQALDSAALRLTALERLRSDDPGVMRWRGGTMARDAMREEKR